MLFTQHSTAVQQVWLPAWRSACRVRTRCAAVALEAETTRVHSEPASVYVHLPFCKRRCHYCDFPVQAVGQNADSAHAQQSMQSYIDVLCQEIAAQQQCNTAPLQTVFFGGGTPSLIPPKLLEQVLKALDTRFRIAANSEISMEADPGTFDAQQLREYMQLGVNRFSVGVQAFDEALLKQCGRSHTLRDVYAAIEDVHAAAPPRWSLDLISGLPDLTMVAWQHSVSEAIKASPHHISVYDLQIESGTPFARWYAADKLQLPSDDAAADMYRHASFTLAAHGFEHYEVSNYAQPAARCRHNMTYWQGRPHYAFGMGAASYLNGRRYTRPATLKSYQSWVQSVVDAGGHVMPGGELPGETDLDRMLDSVMLRLRLKDGLCLRWFEAEFGARAAQTLLASLQPFCAQGLVVHELDAGLVRLKDPDGWLVSNDILATAFNALSP